ncbi:MAG: hypothetical protein JNJ54_36490 [Myxococcaceae bacterium]|nr:hypothetical protein [Myxococcaceae bacterium]
MTGEAPRQLLAAIGSALGLAGPYAPDEFTRVHDGVVRDDGAVAWVEERRVGEDRGGFVDCSLTLKAAWGGALHLEGELPSYNPYFGCLVYGLTWTADERVVLAYHEKHAAIVSVWTMAGAVRLVRCDLHDVAALSSDLVVFRSDEPGLLHVLPVSPLILATPLPVPDAERDFTFTRDGSLRHRDGLVRPPSVEQRARPTDARAFVEAVVARLAREVAVSREVLELLAGSCCEPFWAPAPTVATSYAGLSRPSYEPSLRHFPAWRHRWLRVHGRDREADALLVAFDALEPSAPLTGWDASWTAGPGVVELAAQHLCACASRLRQLCATGRLPAGRRERLFDFRPRARGDLARLPASLQRAYAEVAASPPPPFSEVSEPPSSG